MPVSDRNYRRVRAYRTRGTIDLWEIVRGNLLANCPFLLSLCALVGCASPASIDRSSIASKTAFVAGDLVADATIDSHGSRFIQGESRVILAQAELPAEASQVESEGAGLGEGNESTTLPGNGSPNERTLSGPSANGPVVSAADPLVINPSQNAVELEEIVAGQPASENANPLRIEDVVDSVRVSFPSIRQAMARQAEFSGRLTSAFGNFDDVLEGHSINQPLGYYENYRHGIGVKKPLWGGGYLSSGYRIGDGFFEPWYGERETDEGGEFKLGVDLPLLQGRAIDKRRAELRAAQLERQRTNPELFQEILFAEGAAAVAYWDWIASGLNVRVQQRLLELGIERAQQIESRIELGDVAEFTRIDNERLIASRRIKLIASQQKFGAAAVKLSLYLRDSAGTPSLPAAELLLVDFPEIDPMVSGPDQMIASAVQARPEIQVLQLDASVLRIELAQAQNQLLPELNFVLEGSQDVGGKASSKRDKSEGEVEAGLYGAVPLQRRMARGKVSSTFAKLQQVEAKLQLARDKIANEIQQLLVARNAAVAQIEQARKNVELAEESLGYGRIALENGEITLPVLNIYEQAVADAEQARIEAAAEFFVVDALLQIATGRSLSEGQMADTDTAR